MKRKIYIGIFIIALFVPFSGTYLFLQWQKRAIKHQVKEQLIQGPDSASLVTLQFSKEDAANLLRWEHDREFEYHQQMYDVVSVEDIGDSLSYLVWPDKKESALNQKLTVLLDHIMQRNPANSDKQKQIKDFSKQLYYVAKISPIELLGASQRRFYKPVEKNYIDPYKPLEGPPPKPSIT